ncbi:MAG: rRNA maturation RNase YbeY [Verrucomicrobiota bacterium]
MNELSLRNRQRLRAVHLPLLRRIVGTLLAELLPTPRFELGIFLVNATEMARLNQQFLQQAGPTDVITFDYADASPDAQLHGDLFVCVEEAIRQARQFRTTWQAELVRYIVHGILHLQGYDDAAPSRRRVMKREEDRLLRRLAARFRLSALGGKARVGA